MEPPAPPPPLTIEAVQQELVATPTGERGIRLSQEDAARDKIEATEADRRHEREAEANEKAASLVATDETEWVIVGGFAERDRLWYRVPRGALVSSHCATLL